MSRKTWILSILILLFAAVEITPAFAYSLWTATCPTGRKWSSDPDMKFSSTSFPEAWYRQPIYDIADRIDKVGGHNWNISGWAMRDKVSRDNRHNELWRSQLDDASAIAPRKGRNCKIKRADIIFDSDLTWAHGWPEYYGLDLWSEDSWVDDKRYIRPTALHEMLHMAGLEHVDNQYSMMNYGVRAWSNLPSNKTVDPLPDDRQGLRVLYPSAGGEQDLAVLNSYWDPDDTWAERKVAYQHYLCSSTNGTAWNNDIFDTYCGQNANLLVCPGDMVYSRFTIANHGRQTIDVMETMWFSEDDEWGAGDVISPSVHFRQVTEDYREGKTFTVPPLPQGVYTMIIRVWGGLEEEEAQNNWIPMRHRIIIGPGC